MPLNLSTLTQSMRTLAVKLEDGTLNLTYRPGAITARMVTQERQRKLESSSVEASTESLASVLTSWDLTDDDKPLPVTVEALMLLPSSVIFACWRAIQEDITAPKAKSGT